MNFDWVTQRIYHKNVVLKFFFMVPILTKKNMGPHLRHILRNKEKRTIEIRSSEKSN